MNQVSMIANRALPYIKGRAVAAEEPFEIEEQFVHVLTITGAARRADADESGADAPKRRQYRRRDMVAESSK